MRPLLLNWEKYDAGIPNGQAEEQKQPRIREFPHHFLHLRLIYTLTSLYTLTQHKFHCLQGLLHQQRLDLY